MRGHRQSRSGFLLRGKDAADNDEPVEQVELFDEGARGGGGSARALGEHLQRVESELAGIAADIAALEQVILLTPGRPIERLINPSNELPPSGQSAVVRIHRSSARRPSGPSWLDHLRALPWPQIGGLLVALIVLAALVWLILALRG